MQHQHASGINIYLPTVLTTGLGTAVGEHLEEEYANWVSPGVVKDTEMVLRVNLT